MAMGAPAAKLPKHSRVAGPRPGGAARDPCPPAGSATPTWTPTSLPARPLASPGLVPRATLAGLVAVSPYG